MNWWAEHTKPENYQRRYDTPPFQFIAKQYGENDTVFEVGCGAGVWAGNHLLYGKKGMYKGTDITPEYVEASKKDYPQFQWDVQDAMNLTEPDKSWDIVLGIHFLEYTGGYKTFFERALKIARKKVIIVFWQPIVADQNEEFHPYSHENTYEPMGSKYNREKFIKCIADNGGKIVVDDVCIQDGRIPNWIWVIEV